MRLYQIIKDDKLIAVVWAALPEQAAKYAQDRFGAEVIVGLVPQVGGIG